MWKVIGQTRAVELLQKALERGSLAHAYLLAGPPGIGGRALAFWFAQMLFCQGEGEKPCTVCGPCRKVEKGIYPDLRTIEATEKALSIGQIREELQADVALRPYEGRYKIYILPEFQEASLAAANCLLKTLEEPPPHAILILTASETRALPPTILSRCQVVRLHPPTTQEIAQGLEAHYGLESAQALALARMSAGRCEWAQAAAQDPGLLEARREHLQKLGDILRAGVAGRLRYAQELGEAPKALEEVLQLWQTWWRDLVLVQEGNPEGLVNIDQREELEGLGEAFPQKEVVSHLLSLARTRALLSGNANARLALEVLLLELPAPTSLPKVG